MSVQNSDIGYCYFIQDIKINELTPREELIKNIEEVVDRVEEPNKHKVKCLLERWRNVKAQVVMRHDKLEVTILKFQNFQASLKTELSWLAHAEQKIASPDFQAAPEEMESKMAEFTVSLKRSEFVGY